MSYFFVKNMSRVVWIVLAFLSYYMENLSIPCYTPFQVLISFQHFILFTLKVIKYLWSSVNEKFLPVSPPLKHLYPLYFKHFSVTWINLPSRVSHAILDFYLLQILILFAILSLFFLLHFHLCWPIPYFDYPSL